MPIDTVITLTAIVVAFAIFGIALAWVERRTNS